MAGDQPLLAVPLIREGVARLDDTAVAEGEGVETGIDGGVAVDLDASPVDDTNRLVLQKMLEVVLLLRGADPRLVGDRRQQDRLGRVVSDDLMCVAGLQRRIPAIEQSGDLFLRDSLADLASGGGASC